MNKININESTALLNSFLKNFDKDIIFGDQLNFQITPTNAEIIFNIVNKVIFNNQIHKIPLYIVPEEKYKKILISEFKYQEDVDVSEHMAAYVPKTTFTMSNLEVKNAKIQKEAFFINTSYGNLMTFSYAVGTISHEMIHYFDYHYGDLLNLQIYALLNEISNDELDYKSHFTQTFMSKKKQLEDNGIKIIEDGANIPFDILNYQSAQHIHLYEQDDIVDLLDEEIADFNIKDTSSMCKCQDKSIVTIFR